MDRKQRKRTDCQSLKKGTDLILRHATVPHHSHHFALVAGLRPRLMDNVSGPLVSWRHQSRVILRSFPRLEHPEVECVWNLSAQLGARVGCCWGRCGLVRCRWCWYWGWGSQVIVIVQDRPVLFSFSWWGYWWRHFVRWRERGGRERYIKIKMFVIWILMSCEPHRITPEWPNPNISKRTLHTNLTQDHLTMVKPQHKQTYTSHKSHTGSPQNGQTPT